MFTNAHLCSFKTVTLKLNELQVFDPRPRTSFRHDRLIIHIQLEKTSEDLNFYSIDKFKSSLSTSQEGFTPLKKQKTCQIFFLFIWKVWNHRTKRIKEMRNQIWLKQFIRNHQLKSYHEKNGYTCWVVKKLNVLGLAWLYFTNSSYFGERYRSEYCMVVDGGRCQSVALVGEVDLALGRWLGELEPGHYNIWIWISKDISEEKQFTKRDT